MKKKIVYVPMVADILHEGHINILNVSKKLGKVVVGLFTDEAVATYKKPTYLNYSQRKMTLKNLRQVDEIIPQVSKDYTPNVIKLKPDFVVHGDDWKKGPLQAPRNKLIKTLDKWGGKLVEPKYTKNISSSQLKENINKKGISSSNRISSLKKLLKEKKIVRILESHNSLTGLIIESLNLKQKGQFLEFDGMWSSSLTDSLTKGKPDNQSVDYSTRVQNLSEIMDVTTKPVIFDADNGGRLEHLAYLIKSLEKIGVSGVILEDKKGLKKNSLFSNQKDANQDSVEDFCKKISLAKDTKISDDLFIIARIESFIFNKGLKDALLRADKYSKAGADAIMIHSKADSPKEIFSFSKQFSKSKFFKPLVAVPSTYSGTTEKKLIENGFSIVIYANQMLRAAYPAMRDAAIDILKNQRAKEIEKKITPIKEIISLIK